MKTYKYVLFLRHPETNHCINHWVDVDTNEDQKFLSIHDLLEKLSRSNHLFEPGYTLVGMNIAKVDTKEEEK